MRSKLLLFGEILALAAVYFCSGRFGLSLAFVNASASAVWPPTGLAFAAVLLRGYRLWPGVFLGAFLVNVTTQGSVATSLGIATGNTLEALLGAWLVCRFAEGRKAFEGTRSYFKFVFLAAMLSTTVCAAVGVTTLCLGGFARWAQYGPIWLTWWLGDMVSDLIVAPLLIIWMSTPYPRLKPNRLLEAAGLMCLVVIVGQIVFLGTTSLDAGNRPLEYFAIPPLLWAAIRFRERGAIGAAFVMSCLALWGTLHGFGPFARPDPNESLLLLQAFMGAITMTALVLALVVSEQRKTAGALATARELLRQHTEELEQRVRERTAKLQETVQSLDAFSYTIAHDLRAPLRAMSGFIEQLSDEYGWLLDEVAKGYVLRVKAAAARMDGLILALLELGRLDSAKLDLETVELHAIIRKALVALDGEIETKGAQVLLKEPLLPVRANAVIVEQVIANLLGNALKFVRPEAPPKVEIWTEERAGLVRVCLQDNGIGIATAYLKNLFKPFVRLVEGGSYPGTGIGLAIVRKGIERMGGQVGVQSQPGQGSCFWFELPGANGGK